mmetsp:Transcript_17931/g.27424  ORF Transcript_17931/g.27424 Transcript_17931/m.27424 type:complete len:206 (-) Transcript_17931:788-1405(-)
MGSHLVPCGHIIELHGLDGTQVPFLLGSHIDPTGHFTPLHGFTGVFFVLQQTANLSVGSILQNDPLGQFTLPGPLPQNNSFPALFVSGFPAGHLSSSPLSIGTQAPRPLSAFGSHFVPGIQSMKLHRPPIAAGTQAPRPLLAFGLHTFPGGQFKTGHRFSTLSGTQAPDFGSHTLPGEHLIWLQAEQDLRHSAYFLFASQRHDPD